ncbi:myb-related transcription factor, partner of profilin-like [Agelaius tricolor]|uniref:myb-related transcription factor, partner of profilin-like n=1 Tax=Agelaius tricolor TaxID=9191 RepID=UPI0039F1A2A2
MLQQKGGADHDLCQHQGWTPPSCTGHCPEPPETCPDPPETCPDPGSLSHDTEGSTQSCHPGHLCPPRPSCCPAPHSCKPRRRVEVSPVPPVCPPPVRIHRRPLQQHRPCPPCPEPDPGKPRRRVEQRPEEDEEPPVVLQPPQRRCPCIQRRPRPVPCCPRPSRRCCPRIVPLPPHPGHQQQKQVTLVPLCVKN